MANRPKGKMTKTGGKTSRGQNMWRNILVENCSGGKSSKG